MEHLFKLVATTLTLVIFHGVEIFAAEQPPPLTVEVVAAGLGTDSDKALRNAFMNAVEQAVGLVVDAERLVKNEEVIREKVLTYSDGYVEKFEKIKEAKKDGLYEVRIRAVVRRRQLIEKLKESHVAVTKAEGESLFAEVVTQLEAEKNAAQLLEKCLEGLPMNLLEAKVANQKPKIERKDNDEVAASWTVVVSYNSKAWKENALPRLQRTLEHIATKRPAKETSDVDPPGTHRVHGSLTSLKSGVRFWRDSGVALPGGFETGDKNGLIVAVNAGRNDRGDRRWLSYVIDRATCAPVLADRMLLSPKLRLVLLDRQSEIVREVEIDLNEALDPPDPPRGIPVQLKDRDRNRDGGLVNARNQPHEIAGFFPYFIRAGTIEKGGLIPFGWERIDRWDKLRLQFDGFTIAPFLIFAWEPGYYGDALEIPFSTTLSLDELKRIVAIRCSFVEAFTKWD